MMWLWVVVALYLAYGLLAAYVMHRDEEFGEMHGAPRFFGWIFVVIAGPGFALLALLAFLLGVLAVRWPKRT